MKTQYSSSWKANSPYNPEKSRWPIPLMHIQLSSSWTVKYILSLAAGVGMIAYIQRDYPQSAAIQTHLQERSSAGHASDTQHLFYGVSPAA
jgi:hypothetical protein